MKKTENKNRKYVKKLFMRVMLSIILFLVLSILVNHSDKNLLWFKKHFYDQSFNFSAFSNLYQKYFGKPLPDNSNVVVGKTVIEYTISSTYHDGAELQGVKTILPYKSGIVVFVGEKENYGNTVIIQGMDGIDYWYGNVTDVAIKLYDYVESDQIIANAKDNVLYVVFMKNGAVLDFEEYI